MTFFFLYAGPLVAIFSRTATSFVFILMSCLPRVAFVAVRVTMVCILYMAEFEIFLITSSAMFSFLVSPSAVVMVLFS